MADKPADAAAAAAQAAARINAILAAKGKLAKPTAPALQVQVGTSVVPGAGEHLEKEIDINEVPNPTRYTLTRGQFHKEIMDMFNVSVTTRGRYYHLAEKTAFLEKNPDMALVKASDRPLFLHLSATTGADMEKGVAHINKMIEESKQPRPMQPRPQQFGDHGGQRDYSHRIFVGIDDPTFDTKERIIGPAGTYLQHIISSTGARVSLRGRGSGFIDPATGKESFEAMHILITHHNQKGGEEANDLVESLLSTVRRDYDAHRAAPPPPPPGAYGYPYGAPPIPYEVPPPMPGQLAYGAPPPPGQTPYGAPPPPGPAPPPPPGTTVTPAYPPVPSPYGVPPMPPGYGAPPGAPPSPYGYPPGVPPSPYGYPPMPPAPYGAYPPAGTYPPPPPPTTAVPVGGDPEKPGKRRFKEAHELAGGDRREGSSDDDSKGGAFKGNSYPPPPPGPPPPPPSHAPEKRDNDGFVLPPSVKKAKVKGPGLVDYGDDDE